MRSNRPSLILTVLSLLVLLPACASDKPELTRGWVGGSFLVVTADPDALNWPDLESTSDVTGPMPDTVEAKTGLLVAHAHAGTPLALAGIAEGDLVVSAGGAPVEDPLDFRESVEALQPGEALELSVWRNGELRAVDVTVGSEIYQRWTGAKVFLTVPLPSGEFDLWPFDDGINLFGIVVIGTTDDRHDQVGVRQDYLRSIGDDGPAMPHQERFTFAVMPLGVTTSNVVLRQEAGE